MATPGTHPVPGLGPSWPSFPTTYAAPPNLGPIYNPAPPPSTYMTFGGPPLGPGGPGPINPGQSPSGSSGGGGSLRHTLAASGSGSESDVGGGVANLSISSYPKNLQGVTS